MHYLLSIPHRNVIAIIAMGKAIPLQAWTVPEGSSRLRFPDFKTVGTWKWYCCQPCALVAFTPWKYSWYSFLLKFESTPEPLCAGKDYVNEKFVSQSGIEPATFRLAAQCLNQLRHRVRDNRLCFGRNGPPVGQDLLIREVLRSRRTTAGRTPLDDWSARRWDLYLHKTHDRHLCLR